MSKVIRILEKYRLVVMFGSKDGIKRGDHFHIFEPGDCVFDPITGENLGRIDFVKATAEAEEIYPQFCVCTNTEKYLTLLDRLSGERKPLNVDKSQINGPAVRLIRIGDLVRVSH